MELKDFCKGIGLMGEAADKILSLPISEEEYTRKDVYKRQVKVWKGCKRLPGEETAAYYSLTCRMESRAR